MVESEAAENGTAGSLFKKKKKSAVGFKKTKARGRIRRRSDDEVEERKSGEQNGGASSDHEEEESAMEAILLAKKKRRLLDSALGKNRRGIDSTKLLRPTAKICTASEDAEGGDTSKKDLSQRLQGTFSGGTGGDTVDGSSDGVMQRKHRDAMEDFIRQNLSLKKGDSSETAQEKKDETDMEAKLYAELASSAVQLSGKTSSDDAVQQKQVQEGDVGAGGAMLLGTGIAEVELPVEERIKAAKATEAAATAREMRYQRQVERNEPLQSSATQSTIIPDEMLPTTFGVGTGKRSKKEHSMTASAETLSTSPIAATDNQTSASYSDGPTASSAGADVLRSDVSGLASSYSHNFRMHTHEWVAQKKQEREIELEQEKQQQAEEEGPSANQERMGFEAARRAARGEAPLAPTGDSGTTGGERQGRNYQQRSSDDRAWKTFVQKNRGR